MRVRVRVRVRPRGRVRGRGRVRVRDLVHLDASVDLHAVRRRHVQRRDEPGQG